MIIMGDINISTFHFLCFFLFAVPNAEGQANVTAPWDLLPDMDFFCPAVDVCRRNKSEPKKQSGFEYGYKSCCKECSCDQGSCTKSQNCCFPQLDPVNYVVGELQQCLFPRTEVPSWYKRHMFTSYSMVSENPPDGCKQDENSELNKGPCGDERVAPWGSILPLYSNSTKMIYKNVKCAECHGITDGVVWDAILNCEHIQDVTVIAKLQTIEANSKLNVSDCTVSFSYPGKRADIKTNECFRDMIDTCSETTFDLPDELNMTQDEVIETCTSGFIAPYVEISFYANVFCHICNGNAVSRSGICSDFEADSGRRGQNFGFSVLVDPKFIEQFQMLSPVTADHAVVKVCEKEGDMVNRSNCRNLQCPTGQVMLQDGACIFPMKYWNEPGIGISLRLVPEGTIKLSSLEKILHADDSEMNIDWLTSPWPNKWKIKRIFYCANDSLSEPVVKEFIVELTYSAANWNPKTFLNSVGTTLRMNWNMAIEGNTMLVQQEILEYQVIQPTQYNYFTTEWFVYLQIKVEDSRLNLSSPILWLLYSGARDVRHPTTNYIKTTYFCKQVQLELDEFIFYADQLLVYYKGTDRILFESEFDIVFDKLGNSVPRICLYESVFVHLPLVPSLGVVIMMQLEIMLGLIALHVLV